MSLEIERQILKLEDYKWELGQEDGWEDQAGPGGDQPKLKLVFKDNTF